MKDLDQLVKTSEVDEVRSPGVDQFDQLLAVSGQVKMKLFVLLF